MYYSISRNYVKVHVCFFNRLKWKSSDLLMDFLIFLQITNKTLLCILRAFWMYTWNLPYYFLGWKLCREECLPLATADSRVLLYLFYSNCIPPQQRRSLYLYLICCATRMPRYWLVCFVLRLGGLIRKHISSSKKKRCLSLCIFLWEKRAEAERTDTTNVSHVNPRSAPKLQGNWGKSTENVVTLMNLYVFCFI